MEVSVRELKAHLSRYLRAAQAGEPVVVTSHDKPVARLERIRAVTREDAAGRLASAAGILWEGGRPKGARVRLQSGGKTAADVVLEDRR